MQICVLKGVCVSHGNDKHGAAPPHCIAFVYTVGTAPPTESSWVFADEYD